MAGAQLPAPAPCRAGAGPVAAVPAPFPHTRPEGSRLPGRRFCTAARRAAKKERAARAGRGAPFFGAVEKPKRVGREGKKRTGGPASQGGPFFARCAKAKRLAAYSFSSVSAVSSPSGSSSEKSTSNFVPQLGQVRSSEASISSSTHTTSPQLGQVISYRPASYSSA